MNQGQKDNLYNEIDQEDDMTDAEKRETYFNAIADQENQEEREERGYY